MTSQKRSQKTIEDIPGVGPAIAEKLRNAGYKDLLAIAVSSPIDLAEECEIGERKAMDIIEGAKLCADIGGFETGDVITQKKRNIDKLTTGLKALDELLGGGLCTQSIIEIFGKSGSRSSITELCLQLAVNATLPEKKGGFDSDVIFINSEDSFRPELVGAMAKNLGIEPESVLKKIHVAQAFNTNHQIILVEKAIELAQKTKVRLLIVDSLTSHFMKEYIGRNSSAERQQGLSRHLHDLAQFATVNNAVVVVTNRIGDDMTKINGGSIVNHHTNYKLCLLKGKDGKRTMRLVDSPNLPEGEVAFFVSKNGIRDQQEIDSV